MIVREGEVSVTFVPNEGETIQCNSSTLCASIVGEGGEGALVEVYRG